jgi:hypothetical protein
MTQQDSTEPITARNNTYYKKSMHRYQMKLERAVLIGQVHGKKKSSRTIKHASRN